MNKPTVSKLIRVSRPSPLKNCVIGKPGTNFPNTAVEPYISVNPKSKGKNLIGVWQQDRWSNGGAKGLVAAFSNDGGKTWQRTTLPYGQCTCPNSRFQRASDPWVSIGPGGKAYFVGLLGTTISNDNFLSGIAAATSSDGGETWRNFRVIKTDLGEMINDKPSITADPNKSGFAYVVWDRTTPNTGPTWFSRTKDGGRTWSKARIIFDPGRNNQTLGNQIVIDPRNGTLYNFFTIARGKNKTNPKRFVAVQRSTNSGRTWSGATIVSQLKSINVIDPVTGKLIRGGGNLVQEATINKQTGNLFVVWQDSRLSGGKIDEIAISSSKDGGNTWSKPARVNPPTNKPAFTPMVHVNRAGVVGISYYQFNRLKHSKNTIPIDYFFTFSRDGGRTFQTPRRITGPFNMLRAPFEEGTFTSSGLFLGDYQGITSVKNQFRLFFSKTNSPSAKDPVDVFTTVVKVGG